MGMNRSGEIGRLTEIASPDIGVITNVAQAHLEGLGDIRGVARAKTELLAKISPRGRVLVHGDDPILMEAAGARGKDLITFGLGEGNAIRARNIRGLGPEGSAFEVQDRDKVFPVRLRVPGTHNILNALAASAVALEMGASEVQVQEGLEGFIGIPGRFSLISLPGGALLVDDTYNANPSSVKAALDSVRDLKEGGGRLLVGLGEMMELGRESAALHLEAGGMAAEAGAHWLAAMGEHAGDMVKGAVERGLPAERALAVGSHREMAKAIAKIMRRGDLILIKGSRRVGLERVVERIRRES
jgi:UDP-N-acetylmuramoyl-tripeptide--D-alanyl-D-alanine ligase